MVPNLNAVYGVFRFRVGMGLIAAGLLALLPGCGGGDTKPKPVPVKGLVTYNGKPVAKALVTFYAKGASIPASGESNDAGEFVLSMYAKGDGTLAGENKVTVVPIAASSSGMTVPDPTKLAAGEAPPPTMATRPTDSGSGASEIPKSYSSVSTTTLTVTVKPEGDPNLKLELK